MKALTIYPEWCFAITQMDKRIENRTWNPFISIINQRVALHAGSRIGGKEGWLGEPFTKVSLSAMQAGWKVHRLYEKDKIICFDFEKDGKIVSLNPDNVVKKAIVAVATVTGASESTIKEPPPWGITGHKHWHLVDVDVLPEPIIIPGFQGLWNVPKPIVEQINAQLEMKDSSEVNDYVAGMPSHCTRCGKTPTERDEGRLTPWGEDWKEWLCGDCLLRPDHEYEAWERNQIYGRSFMGSSASELEQFAEEVFLSESDRENIRNASNKIKGSKRYKDSWPLYFKKNM